MGAYKDKNGTWYAQFRFTNWKGEADRKTKRGFATKKEALALGKKYNQISVLNWRTMGLAYC